MRIKIKKLSDNTIIPTKAHKSDACYDIYAANSTIIQPKEAKIIHTGFATSIPDDYFVAVFPRSGMGINRHLRLSNSTGIIDSSFRGEWMISLYNDGDIPQTINEGDRIAQFAVMPVLDTRLQEVDELDKTERDTGGLGSTGT